MRTLIIEVIKGLLQHELFRKENMVVRYRDIGVNVIETPLANFCWNFKAKFGWCPFVVADEDIARLIYNNNTVWSDNINESYETVLERCLVDPLCPSSDTQSLTSDSFNSSFLSSAESSASIMSTERSSNASEDGTLPSSIQRGGYGINSVISCPDLSDVFWHTKQSPNFFLCQRVTSTAFKELASSIQETYCEKQPNWRPLIYTPEMFHVTLCTLSLSSILEVSKCFDCIRDALKDSFCPVVGEPLVLRGLGQFGSSVLYGDVNHSESLNNMVAFLKVRLRESDFGDCIADHFTPHITLMKRSSKPMYRKLKLDRDFVDNYAETDFGTLPVDQLWLCLMGRSRDDKGFYRSFGRLDLTPA